jgi:hypothetical protein
VRTKLTTPLAQSGFFENYFSGRNSRPGRKLYHIVTRYYVNWLSFCARKTLNGWVIVEARFSLLLAAEGWDGCLTNQ